MSKSKYSSEHILATWESLGRNQTHTARELGIPRTTVQSHLKRMGVAPSGGTIPDLERRAEVVAAWEASGGNVSAVARQLELTRATVNHHLRRAGVGDRPLAAGRTSAQPNAVETLPTTGLRRYILTSAQNNTHVHAPVWENLLALAAHYDAEVFVGTCSYNINAYGRLAVKRGTAGEVQDDMWYDPALLPYIARGDGRNIELAPGLVWCGRANILPTAERPLTGFETYTKRASGVFPHARIALKSIASGKSEPTKFNYTTGTVTQHNYIQKKAGLKAEHHHCYGGLLVEVDPEGRWYCRQLHADNDGRVCDLDLVAEDGRVTAGHRAEAITWGDVHHAKLDPGVEELAWGEGGMLDTLRPRHQFMHDLLDFHARSHHERGNPHQMFERYVLGVEDVAAEVSAAARFLERASREDCQTYVVDSNHDNALERWLRDADYRNDPVNAIFFLRAQLAKYQAIAARRRDHHTVEWAFRDAGLDESEATFLREDESLVICPESGGIECGMHGHLGVNGSRASPMSLARMGRQANTGHTHSAEIVDGLYVAGKSAMVDLGYNKGPNSHSHSHVLTYENGRRTIITMWGGKWRG